MSVLLEYHSMQPVSAEAAAQIESDWRPLLKSRCYWSGPLSVGLESTAPSKLVGGNSLFNSGGYETQSGQWMSVSEQEDYLMAWSDTRFIFQKLGAWSKDHGVDWQVYSAGEHIGDVVHGEPDPTLQDFVGGLLDASGLDPSKLAEVDMKFRNRCDPPQVASSNATPAQAKRTPSPSKPWWRLW